MEFKFEKVNVGQHGECYCCEYKLEYDKEKHMFKGDDDYVNSFCISNQLIRLCDEHLKELLIQGNDFLSRK